jgi:hypothetical protein
VESEQGPLGTLAIYWPIVPAPGDCEDGEFGGMNGRRHRSTRRKPAPAPLCPPQIPLDQTRDWTQAAAVGSQRLTASAMARPWHLSWSVGIPSVVPYLSADAATNHCSLQSNNSVQSHFWHQLSYVWVITDGVLSSSPHHTLSLLSRCVFTSHLVMASHAVDHMNIHVLTGQQLSHN